MQVFPPGPGYDTVPPDFGQLIFQSTSVAPAIFSTQWSFEVGSTPAVAVWGDGTITDLIHGWNNKTYATAGTKQVGFFTTRPDKINRLQFGSCDLIGAVPSFSAYTDLTHLYLQSNTLTGNLPSFADCTKLKYFYANNNNLGGVVPSFETCIDLIEISLATNNFSGVLPSFSKCPNLEVLTVAGCPLSGPLPSFELNTHLYILYAGACNFSGIIPSFANCIDLYLIDINNANFVDVLPSFATCVDLQYCYFNVNALSGTIPDFSTCTALREIYFDQNAFSGYTAGSFTTQANLNRLTFYTNNLLQADIDQILADCVISLGIPGRVACILMLEDNVAPSAAGLLDKATLIGAGWTVTTD